MPRALRSCAPLLLCFLLCACGGNRAPEAPAVAPAAPDGTAVDSTRADSVASAGDTLPPADAAPDAAPTSDTPEPPAPAAPPFEGTAGIVDVPREGAGIAVLQDVRTGRHEGFDRVVFAFEDAPVPGYHVEYVDRPVRDCGSGEPVAVAGDAWLEVRITPAQAHTEAGAPTIAYRERAVGLPVLRELQRTCDFEGVVTWVLGVASPNRYRVQELSRPSRLVVDIRH